MPFALSSQDNILNKSAFLLCQTSHSCMGAMSTRMSILCVYKEVVRKCDSRNLVINLMCLCVSVVCVCIDICDVCVLAKLIIWLAAVS